MAYMANQSGPRRKGRRRIEPDLMRSWGSVATSASPPKLVVAVIPWACYNSAERHGIVCRRYDTWQNRALVRTRC